MNLFPTALVVEHLHVETLITVLLGCIDIVGHTAWTLLEIVRKHGMEKSEYAVTSLKLNEMPKTN